MRRALPLACLLILSLALVFGSSARTRVVAGREDFPDSWSPDGHHIVFDRDARGIGRCGMFVIQPDGRGLGRMPGCGTSYAWAPNGRSLAFARGDLQSEALVPGGIFVMERLGGRPRQLTHAAGFVDGFPSWSPDGRWIAFSRRLYRKLGARSWRHTVTNIWLVRPDGSDLHRLVGWPGSDWGASWSPDGQRVVFVHGVRGIQDDLFVADVGTDRMRRLTYRGDNGYPQWSPRGGEIVFERAHHDLDLDNDVGIWSIRPSGRRLRNLTPERGANTDPGWSPDGRLIAFEVDSHRNNPLTGGPLLEIWLMRPDGSGQRPLFSHLAGHAIPNDQSPIWSPDSRRIAFARFNADERSISLRVATVDGRRLLRLTY